MRSPPQNELASAGRRQSFAAVTSADGTTYGYRQLGQGPGLILLHGGMMASQNFVKLAAALSDSFTVYVPDRRGRGRSGPFGDQYSVARDCEDVCALMEKTGARNLFGLSSGAIIALEVARTVRGIERVAAYEPPFALGRSNPAHWAARFDRQIAAGDLAAAMLTVLKGTGDSRLLRLVPEFLLVFLLRLGISGDSRRTEDGNVPISELIPTMHYDAQIVTETRHSLPKLNDLTPEVLLVGGARSAVFLKRVLDALEKLLPRVTRLELPGVGHLAADNEHRPELVAAALKPFFSRAQTNGGQARSGATGLVSLLDGVQPPSANSPAKLSE
jgi:pimeloyl-ACP methyl ester carboxylesterase